MSISIAEYDRQRKTGVHCPDCGGTNVEQRLSAFQVKTSKKSWGSHNLDVQAFPKKGYSMQDVFDFADALGPNKIIHLYNPKVRLKAIVAVDNVACGPAIGGVRMAPDVSAEEAFRLARAMTLKNAAAGLPHGGW
jgi:hypothetical protein